MNVYPFIEAEKQGVGSVATACRLLEVSRSAFYAQRFKRTTIPDPGVDGRPDLIRRASPPTRP
jgi:hypothetical protein